MEKFKERMSGAIKRTLMEVERPPIGIEQ